MSIYKPLISIVLIALSFSVLGQNTNKSDNYQHILDADPKMTRKVQANEIMFDKQEKYLIVNYGNKPTYIIVYEIGSWEAIANFRLTNWVDFTGAYVDYNTNQLYIKEGRFSTDFYRLDISTGKTDIVECLLTPGGCPVIEPKQSEMSSFTSDAKFFVSINKRNRRKVEVYKLKESLNPE